MTVDSLLSDIEQREIELWFEGERLRFRAPKGALTPELRARLSASRAAVVAQLRERASRAGKDAPLSFSQKSLWFLHQQAPASPAYHVAMSARIVSTVDPAALRQALQALVDRHASLRTSYPFDGEAPCQRVVGAGVIALGEHAVPGMSDDELRAAVEADYRRPFDLEHGPLLRVSLYTRAAADHVLLITVHHIAADGWSLLMLLEELTKLYAEAAGGPAAELARPTLDYTDYSAWQEQILGGAEGERLWAYWRNKLASPPPPLELPTDRPRPAMQSFRGASHPLEIDARLTEGVKNLARKEGATPFVVLLAAFQAFLFRLTGANDMIVGAPAFARSKAEFIRVVGDFVNSVPLRGTMSATMSFRDFVAQMRGTVLEALDAQEFPLPLMVQRLQPDRDASRSPLFDTFFVLQRFDQFKELQSLLGGGPSNATIEMGGLQFAPFILDQQEGQFDLALQMVESDGLLRGVFKFSTDLFDDATIRQLADDFVALLQAIERDPGIALGALPLPQGHRTAEGNGVAALLDRLRAADIRLVLEGERLRVNAPKGAMTEELRAAVAARKDQIVAALRRSSAAGDGSPGGVTIRRIPRDGPLPLSSVQQRLWFLDRMGPGGAHYNIGGSGRLLGPLDADTLRRAIDHVVRGHESFRSRIGERDGVPALEIADSAALTLEIVDVSHLPPEQREQEAQRLAGERLRIAFDLAKGPLGAFRLIRLGPTEHILTLSIHHIVFDGWSTLIAMREIYGAYDALAAGRAPALTPASIDYVDYAAWEQEQLQSGQMRRHLNYWKEELADAPAVLELPTDRPRPAAPSSRGHRMSLDFDLALLESLKQLSRQHEVTLFMTLVAAFQLLLHRYSGQDDVVIGSPMANRVVAALEGVVGCFVNNLILRGRVGGNPTFAEFLARTKHATLGAFDHRDLPFDLIVDGVRPDRGGNHAPIFQVLLTLHSFPTDIAAPAGLSLAIVEAPDIGTTRFDLGLEIIEYGGKFSVLYEYASDLFDDETIVRMHAHLERIFRAAIADPACRVEEVPLLGPADERMLLGAWNDTSVEHDRTRCVHQLLEATARATPDATAVVAGRSTLTYRELDERANRLAQLLVRREVRAGSLVAVCLDRTIDMPVALAAVLKAGAAYVPLDPTHPADRLRYTLEDAAVACVITVSRFASLFAGNSARLILLDDAAGELAALPATAPAMTVRPEDRAYVIYTSGSTGRPKGVEVEHRNVVAFLEAMKRTPGCSPSDVLLAVTTLAFDIAGLELWLPLTVGGRVVIASRTDVLDGERLIGLVEEHGITLMQATPATWRLMLDAGWTGRRDLKVLCGGEALPRDLAAALIERVGELWNMYGPTETTIWSTLSRIDDANAPITIGRPIHNTRVYTLERSGLPAPIGVPGELCIGGEGVARGYHDRPELTAEKFAHITLPDGRVERVYRTGDVARFRSDGRIEFLGRRDQQVKVRGYRIELGEIEAVLSTHPGVKECVVAVREDSPGDQRIVGYVVSAEGATFDAEAARTTLRGRLPEYMIPNLVTVLPALPLTPNGKIDRKALPAPNLSAKPVVEASESLMTPTQRRVAASWREVLRTDRVGLHDNFFDIGGHSLLLVKLHAILKRDFGGTLELVELFQWTTVAAQATRLSAVAAPDSALRRAQTRAARQNHD